ncbi:hypothetical protein [Ascidiimonas sp. W6]|uniref:hypothetical protein n=1 Tax=Ascidiimonas meishanensis TaxID=3128903 RepID=UPI0030EDF700
MMLSLANLQQALIELFSKWMPPLRIRKNNPELFEVYGSKEAMQDNKKVDGFFFVSIISKLKDIRLYYFPICTHPDDFTDRSRSLRKLLKGKNCFYLKNMEAALLIEIEKIIEKEFQLIQIIKFSNL